MRLSTAVSALAALSYAVAHPGETYTLLPELDAQTVFWQDNHVCESNTCILAPEIMEGPFYVAPQVIRSNVTEDSVGLPLNLTIQVINIETCEPVAGIFVDIWNCDAFGVYSGYEHTSLPPPPGHRDGPPPRDGPPERDRKGPGGGRGGGHAEPTNNSTFLRGVLLTSAEGLATFNTIFPVWYQGRNVHIHIKVHTDSTDVTVHTGQLWFTEEVQLQVASIEPYSKSNVARKKNEEDGAYRQSKGVGTIEVKSIDLEKGLEGFVTIGVDLTARYRK